MKKQHKTSKYTLGLLAISGALAVASAASAKNPKSVDLEIVNNKLVMLTSERENDCPGDEPREKGCIKVKKNNKSKIYFHLKKDECTLEGGHKWELNAVYLGGYNAPRKPDEFGFDSTLQANYDKVNSDFTITDRSTGQVKLIEKSAKKLAINDENQHKYVVWYKIEAICKRSETDPDPYITTYDPRVRNDGGSG
jgi:hypothetical protein